MGATVAVDTQRSVLGSIYDTLSADSTLKTAMGGTVRLYPVQAAPDTLFPFMVHRLDMGMLEPFPMREATYILDIFSDGDNINEITTIRQRLITLLDEKLFSTTDVVSIRMWLQTEGFVPEIESGIWHYAIQMNVRMYRKGEVAAILAR